MELQVRINMSSASVIYSFSGESGDEHMLESLWHCSANMQNLPAVTATWGIEVCPYSLIYSTQSVYVLFSPQARESGKFIVIIQKKKPAGLWMCTSGRQWVGAEGTCITCACRHNHRELSNEKKTFSGYQESSTPHRKLAQCNISGCKMLKYCFLFLHWNDP